MVMHYLNLFRWKNLLITGFTILLTKYAIFEPAIRIKFSESIASMDFRETLLLAISVMFIAAAGFVINDINDIKSDEINKPNKVIVGKYISVSTANNLYIALNAFGIFLGAYIGSLAGNYKLAILHVIVATILWIYSRYVKNSFLIGNVLVSLSTALVPITYFFFESFGYLQNYGDILIVNFKKLLGGPLEILFNFSIGLSIFSFVISLIREIIKDLQDYQGDFFVGANTIPIVLGEKGTKIIVQIMSFGLIGMIFYANYFWLTKLNIGKTPFTIYNCIFLFLLILLITSIRKSEDYQKQSNICKLIMMLGALSPIVYAFNV